VMKWTNYRLDVNAYMVKPAGFKSLCRLPEAWECSVR
jgi:hypothetical protein